MLAAVQSQRNDLFDPAESRDCVPPPAPLVAGGLARGG